MSWLERLAKQENRDLRIAIAIWCAWAVMFGFAALFLRGSRGRRHGTECSAISALRTISSSQELYNTRYGSYGTLAGLARKNLIDSVLAHADGDTYARPKSGYLYSMTINGSDSWCCVAYPFKWSEWQTVKYRVTQDGVIYKSKDRSTYSFDSGGTPLGG